MGGHGVYDRLALAVLAQEVDTEREMGSLQVPVDGLPDVVHERAAYRRVRVESHLAGHDAGQVGDLLRMPQHVLAVAGAELQLPHQPVDFRLHVEEPQLERRRLALLEGQFVLLDLDLFDDFFDAGGMDPAVRDQPLDGLFRHFAAEGIEARQNDRAGGVVDDQLDAGGLLEGPDVSAFAADDASLEIVAGQVDDRDRGLDGMLGGATLDGLGDDLLRLLRRHFPGFRFEPLDEVGGVAASLLFDLLDDEILRLVGGETGDALQGLLLLADQLVAAVALLGEDAVPVVELPLPFIEQDFGAFGLAILIRQLLGPAGELPLDGRQLVPSLLALMFTVLQQGVGLLLGGELRLLPVGVSLPAGVMQEPFSRFRRPNGGAGGAFAGDDPHEAHDEHGQEDARGRDKVHG